MNIPLMKRIDGTIGKTVARLLPPSTPALPPSGPETALLIRPGGIGDAVHLAPSIVRLRRCYPRLRITVLAERRNAGIFPLVGEVDDVRCYDIPADLASVLSRRYDLVIDTEQWHRLSAAVARIVRAGFRIGFGTNPERSRLFTRAIPYDHDRYEASHFLDLLEPLGIGGELSPPPWLSVTDGAVREAERLLAEISTPFVAIFPGASIPERRWGADRFGVIVRELALQGIGTVTVGGMPERGEGEMLARLGALNLTGRCSLLTTAAVVARSSLLLSGDSGILHLAVALGIPTLSLFGPGRHRKWAPQGEKHRVLRRDIPCSPCTTFGTTPPCSYGIRCMRDILPSQVAESIHHMLGI